MFYLHHGNRLEQLAQQLAEVHRFGSDDPFIPETIIVQNAGMARWLSLCIADSLGIAANLKFLFPAEYMWQLIRRVVDDLPELEPFRPGVLRWRIMQVLNQDADQFPEVAHYIKDNHQCHAFQLAVRLEDVFNQCLFYRPDWIEQWETGDLPHWQARLWSVLTKDSQAIHWVGLQTRFLQNLEQSKERISGERVLIFGIAQLSPGYLRLLREAARFIDVHLFVMNPCREYWGDIVTESTRLKSSEVIRDYLDTGHPLLASMGRQGRDYLDQLIDLEPDEELQCFQQNPNQTLLATLQNDILNLHHPDCTASEQSSQLQTADGSIVVHSCHTPMREVEVLYDQLLDLFNRNAQLKPEDVIIMMPSVQLYAPLFDAVFSNRQHSLPFTVADSNSAQTSQIADLLNMVMDLPDSRYEVNHVLGLLEFEPLRKRFKFTEDDIPLIRQWCQETRICWGIDQNMRQSMGLQATEEHTWRAGIERMLLGFMLNNDALFSDTLPYTEIEGSIAVKLGRFVEFTEFIFNLRKWCEQQQTLDKWLGNLYELLANLMDEDSLQSAQILTIQSGFQHVLTQAISAGYCQQINFQLFRDLTREIVAGSSQREFYASGGITCCELIPMRSVPFKVVCLIGLNDGQFPTPSPQYSFDLFVEDRYRRGDRSRRTEERYLFLESVLAAREALYLSFVGKDVRKNTSISPSVLISELMDVLNNCYGVEIDDLLTEHPLHAFSQRYYQTDNDLFTYNDYQVSSEGIAEQAVFCSETLDSVELPKLHLNELIRFIRFPVRYFLDNRLQIRPDQYQRELPEREPFEITRSEQTRLRREIYQNFHEPENTLVKRLRGQGMLPHGTQGQQFFEQEYAVVNTLLDSIDNPQTRTVQVQLEVDNLVLTGAVERVTDTGISDICFGKIWCEDILEYWINHLALSTAWPDARTQTRIHCVDRLVTLDEVSDPLQHLRNLVQAYRFGQSTPLHFMPKTSMKYAKSKTSTRSRSTPIDGARTEWIGASRQTGECQNLYYLQAFRGIDPLDQSFEEWAERIWIPILEHYND